jgi:hypothetical protein
LFSICHFAVGDAERPKEGVFTGHSGQKRISCPSLAPQRYAAASRNPNGRPMTWNTTAKSSMMLEQGDDEK